MAQSAFTGVGSSQSQDFAESEQTRWLTWLGIPAIVAAFSLGLTFWTGSWWPLLIVFIAFLVDVCFLVWLGLHADEAVASDDGVHELNPH